MIHLFKRLCTEWMLNYSKHTFKCDVQEKVASCLSPSCLGIAQVWRHNKCETVSQLTSIPRKVLSHGKTSVHMSVTWKTNQGISWICSIAACEMCSGSHIVANCNSWLGEMCSINCQLICSSNCQLIGNYLSTFQQLFFDKCLTCIMSALLFLLPCLQLRQGHVFIIAVIICWSWSFRCTCNGIFIDISIGSSRNKIPSCIPVMNLKHYGYLYYV